MEVRDAETRKWASAEVMAFDETDGTYLVRRVVDGAEEEGVPASAVRTPADVLGSTFSAAAAQVRRMVLARAGVGGGVVKADARKALEVSLATESVLP